jgi:chromosomal replication initiation ATPase DnaA
LPVWNRKGRGLKAMPRAAQLVVMDVAERNALTVEMLLSDRRYRAITHPRQECYALLYATGRYSLPLIASWFGVDHTTVLHGRKAFSKRLENPKPDDPENESMREYWRWLKQRQKAAA